jgi:alpha-L-fucosidase
MKSINMAALFALATLAACARAAAASEDAPKAQAAVIVKKGTIDLDLVETTPFVFKGRLYRMESHRRDDNLRIMDHDSQSEVCHFGAGHRFACAYAEGDTVYVVGTKATAGWTGDTLTMFTSRDLKTWEEQTIFCSHGDNFCNTTLCKAGERYVMAYERNRGGFHAQFLESKDLRTWKPLPEECKHHLGRYCAPHCLRYYDGWFYLFYLEADRPHGFEQYVTRSRDLMHWEPSPLNPVLFASPQDKLIANSRLTEEQREKIAKATDCNNSDIDFCEFHGRLIINYSWGNQAGTEFLAEAESAGTTAQFLQRWFPH